ncbi:MAG TPA: hypothetical protein VF861_05645, partial [Telluria sp.]
MPNMKKRAFALAGIAGALAMSGLITSCTTVKPGAPGAPTRGMIPGVTPGALPATAQAQPPAAP